MTFRVLAALAMLLLSAPSALGVQRALAPTRGELAGWLAALQRGAVASTVRCCEAIRVLREV